MLREWQARVFTQQVAEGQEELYRLPIALKDFAMSGMKQPDLSAPQLFSGVMYPSVALHLFGDNVAILPSEVDAHLALLEVALLTLDGVDLVTDSAGKTATNWHVKPYDYARPDSQGKLIWGQKSQIAAQKELTPINSYLILLPPE